MNERLRVEVETTSLDRSRRTFFLHNIKGIFLSFSFFATSIFILLTYFFTQSDGVYDNFDAEELII